MSKILDSFKKNGFIYLKSYFDENEIKILDQEYQLLIHKAKNILSFVSQSNMSLKEFYQQNQNELIVIPEVSAPLKVCRFEYIAAYSNVMNKVAAKKLENLISNMLERQFILFKDKCNVKEPGGGAFPAHQDITAYFYFKPKFHITAAVMLDNSNIQNGCLEIATNYQDISNKEKYKIVQTCIGNLPILNFEKGGVNNGNIKDVICKNLNWQPIEGGIGDIILFHSFIPHCSKVNVSSHGRRNLFFTFNLNSDGDFYQDYYKIKRQDYNNPIFHISTPTSHDGL